MIMLCTVIKMMQAVMENTTDLLHKPRARKYMVSIYKMNRITLSTQPNSAKLVRMNVVSFLNVIFWYFKSIITLFLY